MKNIYYTLKEAPTPKQELKIKKPLFKADKNNRIRLLDSGTSFHYDLVCQNCEQSKIRIVVTEKYIRGCSYFYHTPPRIARDEMVKSGGAGLYYKYYECEYCRALYYFGIGWIEPNNGRDVFILHCIWEVEKSV